MKEFNSYPKAKGIERLKQNAKVILIISCVFAFISGAMFIIMLVNIPALIKNANECRYLYDNGIEVDAHIKDYHINYFLDKYGFPYQGRYVLVIEYVSEDGNSYIDKYEDDAICREDEAYEMREQYINKMMNDGITFKMLIADNGRCILVENKEDLISNTHILAPVLTIVISAIILCICAFGIVWQSKKLIYIKKRFEKSDKGGNSQYREVIS